jgi:PEP-CTERM motif
MNKTILSMIAVAALAGPLAANAIPVNTSAGTYDFTVVEDNFSDISGLLLSQVWWGNSALASEFALATASALGVSALNSSIFGVNTGPLFAICTNQCLFGNSTFPLQGWLSTGPVSINAYGTDNRGHAYAIAKKVPEPGSLALLGLGLIALGFARRRRTTN